MPLPNNASLQDVINSLNSTQGVNAKTELASVIGSPAVASDEVLTQVGKLQISKNALAEKLSVPTNTSIQDMVDMVGGLGKKISGEITLSATTFNVTNLEFTPSVFITRHSNNAEVNLYSSNSALGSNLQLFINTNNNFAGNNVNVTVITNGFRGVASQASGTLSYIAYE